MATTLEKDFNARRLRHRVRLERPDNESDFGGRQKWAFVGEVSAELVPRSSTEVVAGERVEGLGTHKATIRWRDDVQSSWRLVHSDGRVFNIKGIPVDVEERRRWLELALVQADNV